MSRDIFRIIFWFIIPSLFVWPQMKHRMLQGSRLSLIRRIEKLTNSRSSR